MPEPNHAWPQLSDRQAAILRALVAAYIAEPAPVGSQTLSNLLPMSLSSASVRNTLSELMELGLIEKPHPSAGRIPTEQGLRVFVECLLDPRGLGPYERRDLAGTLDAASPETLARVTSQLLSERTHLLGFVVPPRVDRVPLRHVALVRLSAQRVLALLVSQRGATHQLMIEEEASGSQAELDRIAAALNELGVGFTLAELRERLASEATALCARAGRLLERAIGLARRTLDAHEVEVGDWVIATRLALLDQPEFHDPERIRQLFEALEARKALIGVLDQMLAAPGVHVAFGAELAETDLSRLALVAAPYGEPRCPLGLLGVIGPTRMDYARVIPLVEYLSELVTEKFCA